MAVHTYLFPLVDGGGTVPPELGVARRLVDRGHHVTVLAEDSMADEVAATGATMRRWETAPNRPDRTPEHDPLRDWEVAPRQMLDRLVETMFVGPAPRYAADTRAAVADVRPDLVVCSTFALGAMIAAESAGVPFDVLIPNAYPLPAPGRPPFGMGLQPAGGPLGRLRDRAITAVTTRVWDRKTLPRINDLRSSSGLAPLLHSWDQFHHARRQLVLTSPAFDFPAELPDAVRYVGPVLDDPAWAADVPWTPPPGTDPLVLVALSSTFQDQVRCLQRVIDALAPLPVRGVVTTGPAIDPVALTAPAHVAVVAAAPHTEVLRDASLVVTHGGHGTVLKALAADLPMVVLHHGRDQIENAARLTARGAALTVRRSAGPAAVRTAIRRVLTEPSFADAARRLGAAIRRDAVTTALLDELENLSSP